MLYVGADEMLQDCSEMDDHSTVGASDIIQDYKRTGGFLPRTYSGSNTLEVDTTTRHITGATPVRLNGICRSNTRLSSADSNSSLGSSSSSDEASYKVIAVSQTARDFWIALTVFHGRLVAFSFQLSEAENVVKAQDAKVSPKSHSPQQHSIVGEQVEPRLLSLLNSSRTPLAQMNSARCSVGAAFVDGKIIVCGEYSAHISKLVFQRCVVH
ncbi:unnamed protein product [Gongylonema pulchrum]|uniref:CPSF_A domain-containing protein n=1 Tax=Gongylonema pulchrum TaxID=637853 RepID=A0A183EH20_9BILA|nr:unnamed protein product [Gongylonema pulchrum]